MILGQFADKFWFIGQSSECEVSQTLLLMFWIYVLMSCVVVSLASSSRFAVESSRSHRESLDHFPGHWPSDKTQFLSVHIVSCPSCHLHLIALPLYWINTLLSLKRRQNLPFCKNCTSEPGASYLAHSTQTVPASQWVSKCILWCYSVVEVIRQHSLKHFSRFYHSVFSPHQHETPEWHSSLVEYAGMAGVFQYLL